MLRKFRKKIYSYLYKPIPVFVFHQAGEDFNTMTDYLPIWSSMDLFKSNIDILCKKYKIISIKEANLLMQLPFRIKRYAVITFDDSYQSTLNSVSYLIENKIPCTWFINSAYLDQNSYSIANAKIYLNQCTEKEGDLVKLLERTQHTSEEEYLNWEKTVLSKTSNQTDLTGFYISNEKLFSITSPYLSIGMHGHRHWDSRYLSMKTFRENIDNNREHLESHPCFIPYFALPYGSCTKEQAKYLVNEKIPTLLCDNDLIHTRYPLISRYCADGVDLSKVKLY